MKKLVLGAVLSALVAALAGGAYALAGGSGGGGGFGARLDGWQEVPSQVRPGEGRFRARVISVAGEPAIEFVLRYSGLEADATAAHIHIGSRHENGGVSAFLCGPQPDAGDKPVCPARAGEVRGVIDRPDVVGPAAQGVAAQEIEDLIRALRHGETYANVHTAAAPGGEIRGQIRHGLGHGFGGGHDK